MIEIPESATLGSQIIENLAGKEMTKVCNATSLHKFTWYNGDPLEYPALLVGRRIETAKGYGAFVDIVLDEDTHLLIGDGTNIGYYPALELCPSKYQLLIVLDDNSALVFTVAMYGAIYAFRGVFDNPYYQGSIHKISPLDERFDENYFENLFRSIKKDLSAKAFLATEQRIPGLGNGVLQDILFYAGIHPKRKMSTIRELEKQDLFYSLKNTLANMADKGGRDTEKDLFGNRGGYRMVLSKNTYGKPCPNCGAAIVKEPYLGGAVYYCPGCQP